jgi:hypothetical protein
MLTAWMTAPRQIAVHLPHVMCQLHLYGTPRRDVRRGEGVVTYGLEPRDCSTSMSFPR